jgi:hypothetical protein
LSVTTNFVVAPRADTRAPASGLPRSSWTTPWIAPGLIEAMRPTGWSSAGTLCPWPMAGVHKIPRTPSAVVAALLVDLISPAL